MKKFKNILLSVLSLALVAVLSIGGTIAYLTSEDEDVNVMTMGNVKIEQLEYERVVDENGNWVSTGEKDKYNYIPDQLQEFTQSKPLYPAVFTDGDIKWDDRNGSQTASGATSHQQSWNEIGASGSNQLFDDSVKNVQDKFVFVKNTGKSDAYVRTWIAFEQGSIAADEYLDIVQMNMNVNGNDGNPGHWEKDSATYNVEIDGNNYYVMSLTYRGPHSNPNGVLASGKVSYPSLLQVYMKPAATNEDVEAIDGNGNGTYDILVLSQAVQTKGFADAQTALDTAFGTEHPWVPETISTINWAEVKEAAAEKRVIIELTNDLGDEDKYIQTSGSNTTINGNGYNIVAGTLDDYAGIHGSNSIVTYNDININSEGGGIGVSGGSKVTFNSGKVYVDTTNTSGRYNFYVVGGSKVTINGGTFSFSSTKNQKRAYIYVEEGSTVYVNGGTFGKASTRDGYTAGILGNGTVIITGGTFGFDPSNWVASGYKAVKDGSTWTVIPE